MSSASPNRIIIDTDPGVDDVLAMLLALAAEPEEVEVLLLSVTYGNVGVHDCLRNVVAMFHVLERELAWRRNNGHPTGSNMRSKPIVAVGAEHPLEDDMLMADHYHGIDGLAGVHESHPHLSPSDTWRTLFQPSRANANAEEVAEARLLAAPCPLYTPCHIAAHKEILRLLQDNPPDTITIICIGPMTNLALAAAEDPETLLRVKEVVVMGGAIDVAGNITPCAEFNTYADPVSTARVMALTSPNPSSTMPPIPPKVSTLPAYPTKLSRLLKFTLFPLDVTTPHLLHRSFLDAKLLPLVKAGSPLAEWTYAFISKTIQNVESMTHVQVDPGLEMHDAVCVWYAMTRSSPAWKTSPKAPEDIRVETSGQWTRGMHIVDRRMRRKLGAGSEEQAESSEPAGVPAVADSVDQHASSDNGGWLDVSRGNRINRIFSTPGESTFGKYLLERIFD